MTKPKKHDLSIFDRPVREYHYEGDRFRQTAIPRPAVPPWRLLSLGFKDCVFEPNAGPPGRLWFTLGHWLLDSLPALFAAVLGVWSVHLFLGPLSGVVLMALTVVASLTGLRWIRPKLSDFSSWAANKLLTNVYAVRLLRLHGLRIRQPGGVWRESWRGQVQFWINGDLFVIPVEDLNSEPQPVVKAMQGCIGEGISSVEIASGLDRQMDQWKKWEEEGASPAQSNILLSQTVRRGDAGP